MTINAPQAYLEGPLHFDHGPGYAHDWLTGWTDADAKVWFDLDVVRPGSYAVTLHYACPEADAGSTVRVRAGKVERTVKVPAAPAPQIPLAHRDGRSRERYVSRDWGELPLGQMQLEEGAQHLTIQPQSIVGRQLMELKGVTLERQAD